MANATDHLKDVLTSKYGVAESETGDMGKEELANQLLHRLAIKHGASEGDIAGLDRQGLILNLLGTVATDVLKVKDSSKLTAETSFQELGADSLDMVELLMGIEDTFVDFGDLKIPDEDAANITTMGSAVTKIDSYINSYLAA